jgi:hypothetical protein
VEDAPAAPSWTDQGPGSTVIKGDPNATAMPDVEPALPTAAPVAPAPTAPPKTAAARTSSDDRIIKAPNLAAPKKRTAMDIVLMVAVVAAIVIIVACLVLVAWVVFKGPGP